MVESPHTTIGENSPFWLCIVKVKPGLEAGISLLIVSILAESVQLNIPFFDLPDGQRLFEEGFCILIALCTIL